MRKFVQGSCDCVCTCARTCITVITVFSLRDVHLKFCIETLSISWDSGILMVDITDFRLLHKETGRDTKHMKNYHMDERYKFGLRRVFFFFFFPNPLYGFLRKIVFIN